MCNTEGMELRKPPIPPTERDVEERKRRAFADVDEFTVTTHERSLCKKTKAERERAWRLWNRFVTDVLQLTPKEADKVWFGVCQNKKKAIAICKSFLADYTRYAKCRRLYIDGPEEQKQVPTVQSVVTIIALWKHIVAQADAVVLAKRRDQDSNEDSDEDSEQWRLLGNRGKARGEVIQWIQSTLAQKSNLSCRQTFEKTEATTDDVLLILSTLWERAADIPCAPRHRLAFHTLVLIGSIGFRPGTYENMLYRQVKLLVVRDPDTKQSRLVAEITINQNKLSANKIDKGADVVTFSATMVPCQIVCLVTFVAIQALHDDAFETEFSSFDELLQRPNLEDVDCIELRWKDGMQEKPIFPLKYYRFLELWNRTWLVAGNRNTLRPYALRIGGGNKIDGSLTSAIRNHILSHNTKTFETSYQARHIPHNLMSFVFDSTSEDDSKLFKLLASASLRRDDKAPLYPTVAMLETFENREDMKALRAQRRHFREELKLSADNREVKQLTAKIGNLRTGLSNLAIKQARENYFAEVDSLRARGLSTEDMPPPPSKSF
ncbi:hypothetical protein B0T09DRAFT_334751 [Sordaria sp. MPI-SDFR-AT-0083]|nr:hypothetical protein B0T09DRAFT_334751 [Sordaria sp. MPI-SDFR-AT-0083]